VIPPLYVANYTELYKDKGGGKESGVSLVSDGSKGGTWESKGETIYTGCPEVVRFGEKNQYIREVRPAPDNAYVS